MEKAKIQKSQAKAGVEAEGTENAIQRPSVESVSRPDVGRSISATSEIMDATAGETAPIKPKQGRPLSDKIDRNAPASVVIGKFGCLTQFSQISGYPVSTVHDWTVKGLIPSGEFANIIRLAQEHGVPIERADFVPAGNS